MEYFKKKVVMTGRIDKILSGMSELSRTRIKKLVQQGYVWHNDELVDEADYRVQIGDDISWAVPEIETLDVEAEDIPLDILYEDEDLLVVNKVAFMCVHPAPGQWHGTLVNALLHHCGENLSTGGANIGGVMRPGIVHRLDKDTSGILVVAKNDKAHQHLSAQFFDHSIKRYYIAFTKKAPEIHQACLEGYIGRHPVDRKRMHLYRDESKGKKAIMNYKLQEIYGNQTAQIECELHTGRTHQIRVQMSAVALPLIGDPIYGAKVKIAGEPITFHRQALHAAHLSFRHPRNEEIMSFTADLPADLQNLQKTLRAIMVA